jgi:hypothetical protein
MNQPLFSEAKLRYDDGDYHTVTQGTFVRCAVTGASIPLAELKYWSVERQEAYVSAEVVAKKYFKK